MTAKRKVISHSDLDRKLAEFAKSPDDFAARAAGLAREFEDSGIYLEIADSSNWMRVQAPQARRRISLRNQFQAEVDRFLPLEREEEARLARRIEFARYLLECARADAGLRPEESTDANRKGGEGRFGSGDPGGSNSGCNHTAGRKKTEPAERRVNDFPRFSEPAETPAPERDSGRNKAASTDGRAHELVSVMRRESELHALRAEMVERNLYLVLINVERYSQSGANRGDLIQEGNASLFRAVDGFDWKRGLLFRTYAVHWLNQAFRNYYYNFSKTVRVPVYLQKALKHINRAQIRLADPKASARDIAENAELKESLVTSALAAARSSRSLEAGFQSDDEQGGRLRDLLTDERETGPYDADLEDVSLEDGLTRAMQALNERERNIVRMRFGLDGMREHTLAEVADHLGVSVERVRQIQVRAISKMNTPALRRDMDPFLN